MKNTHEIVSTVRDSLAAHRAHRADRHQRQELARELAGYSSPTDRLELEEILGRYSDSDTRDVRDILHRQSVRAA